MNLGSASEFKRLTKAPETVLQEGIHDLRNEVMKVHSKISLERIVHVDFTLAYTELLEKNKQVQSNTWREQN